VLSNGCTLQRSCEKPPEDSRVVDPAEAKPEIACVPAEERVLPASARCFESADSGD